VATCSCPARRWRDSSKTVAWWSTTPRQSPLPAPLARPTTQLPKRRSSC
jgi:hypothetical protein